MQRTAATKKNRVAAGVLALLLGGVGVHKFYLGAWGWGLVYLLFCWTWIPTIVAFIEGIRYLILSEEEFSERASKAVGPFSFLW
jgi:TM2 domain-containing membrane protein YozV